MFLRSRLNSVVLIILHMLCFTGLIDEIDSPSYASAAGLLLYGAHSGPSEKMSMPVLSGSIQIKQVTQKVSDLIKSFLP